MPVPWRIQTAVRRPGDSVVLTLVCETKAGAVERIEAVVVEAPANFEACVGAHVTGDATRGILCVQGKPWLQRVGAKGNRLKLVPKGK